MAPLRRYLRISKYSVLETRIYLDNPAHSETWLLRRSDPALSRIIETVRPLVLPKLREERERERGKGKGKSKKGVRDVISGDDFEVSIFLTPTTTRHTLLTKRKDFKDKPRLKSNSGKLTGWLNTGTSDRPLEIERDGILREEEEDDVVLSEIPEADPLLASDVGSKRTKRSRKDDDQALFVQSSGESEEDYEPLTKVSKRKRGRGDKSEDDVPVVNEAVDDKKKLALNTSYEGFSIYGRILCLVVKRKGVGARVQNESGQQMMENWVSTQAAGTQGDDEDGDDG
ncbi:hypothetical protein K490DRAFT_72722 [Saccharata proteae CBS 121410]|uniref:Uncharacterized protein n=1 Tax=Saccharata proteae CBS 121410 TaxID=1314787 RepID=A0A6A5YE49_9PEZI|nr:hypothetical protein K490DRAFT_72722 [Saccharata proteae CBS 121410]